jgi:hypothetical protein
MSKFSTVLVSTILIASGMNVVAYADGKQSAIGPMYTKYGKHAGSEGISSLHPEPLKPYQYNGFKKKKAGGGNNYVPLGREKVVNPFTGG